jgi:hypothetical protein
MHKHFRRCVLALAHLTLWIGGVVLLSRLLGIEPTWRIPVFCAAFVMWDSFVDGFCAAWRWRWRQ